MDKEDPHPPPHEHKDKDGIWLSTTTVLFILGSLLFAYFIVNILKLVSSASTPSTRVTTEDLRGPGITLPGFVFCPIEGNTFHSLDFCFVKFNGLQSNQTRKCDPTKANGAAQFNYPVSVTFTSYGADLPGCAVLHPNLFTFNNVSSFIFLQFATVQVQDAEVIYFGSFKQLLPDGRVPDLELISVLTARGVNSVRIVAQGYKALHHDAVLRFDVFIVPLYAIENYILLNASGIQLPKGAPRGPNDTLITITQLYISVQSVLNVQKTTEFVQFGFVEFLGAIGGAFSLAGIARAYLIGKGKYQQTGVCQWCVLKRRAKKKKVKKSFVTVTVLEKTQFSVVLN